MPQHTVVVSPDLESLAKLAQYRPVTMEDRQDHHIWRVECSDPAACDGWIECRRPHEVDGVSAADGPWDTVCGCGDDEPAICTVPWCGRDEFAFHGEAHEWRWGHGWTVDYPGCPVVSTAPEGDLPDGIPRDRPGRYPVEVEWDDETVYLTLAPAMV